MGPNQQGCLTWTIQELNPRRPFPPLKVKVQSRKMGTLTLQKVNKLLLNEWEGMKFQTKESPAELPAHQSIPAAFKYGRGGQHFCPYAHN